MLTITASLSSLLPHGASIKSPFHYCNYFLFKQTSFNLTPFLYFEIFSLRPSSDLHRNNQLSHFYAYPKLYHLKTFTAVVPTIYEIEDSSSIFLFFLFSFLFSFFSFQFTPYGIQSNCVFFSFLLFKIYREINIQIVLAGLEIWTIRDQFKRSADAGIDLSNFKNYRNKHLRKKIPHDNAHLLRFAIISRNTKAECQLIACERQTFLLAHRH